MAIYRVKVEGREYEVTVADTPSGGAHVTVEGTVFDVEPAVRHAPVAQPVASPASTTPHPVAPAPAAAPQPGGGSGNIHAPIPGVITKILVSVGDSVEAGQVVLKLEAMKMELRISAPFEGRVNKVHCSAGQVVERGQLLVEIE